MYSLDFVIYVIHQMNRMPPKDSATKLPRVNVNILKANKRNVVSPNFEGELD